MRKPSDIAVGDKADVAPKCVCGHTQGWHERIKRTHETKSLAKTTVFEHEGHCMRCDCLTWRKLED